MLTVYVGDICLGSGLERAFPKKYSFGLGVTEEFPFPRGVRDELILKEFSDYFAYSDPCNLFKVYLLWQMPQHLKSQQYFFQNSLPSSIMAPMAESTNWLEPILVDLQPLMQRSPRQISPISMEGGITWYFCCISWAVLSRTCFLRLTMQQVAPNSVSLSVMALPMPVPPPVMKATCPLKWSLGNMHPVRGLNALFTSSLPLIHRI